MVTFEAARRREASMRIAGAAEEVAGVGARIVATLGLIEATRDDAYAGRREGIEVTRHEVRRNAHVVVDEDEPLVLGELPAEIARRGESAEVHPVVAGALAQQFERFGDLWRNRVGLINDHHLEPLMRLRRQVTQAVCEKVAPLQRRDNDRHAML